MKRNRNFFTALICILGVSSLLLTGCMYAIGTDMGGAKSYDLGEQVPLVLEDAPQAQTQMQEKFGAYLQEDGRVLTVFSEEQYAQLASLRDEGQREPLSYEEVLYLVNDSISLYFSYDEIRLTNANADQILPLFLEQSSNTCFIYPNHGDYSECETYAEAMQVYEAMLREIYAIIYYRIYMHDAGFETVFHSVKSGKDLIFGNRYNKEYGFLSSAVPVGVYQMLAVDEESFSGEENDEKLANAYTAMLEWERMVKMDAVIDYAAYPELNAPAVLCTPILNTPSHLEYIFIMVGADMRQETVYPTAELTAMAPSRETHYLAKAEENALQPMLSLNYNTGRFSMTAHISVSFAITGTFDDRDGVVKLYPENADDQPVGTYFYVLYEQDGGYLYSKENSNPISFGGYDWPEGLVFEKLTDG